MLEPAVARQIVTGSHRIIVTGASGWLGMATIDLLQQALGKAFENRVVCFGSSERDLVLRNGTAVRQQPLSRLAKLTKHPSWVLHFAFLTKDRAESMDESAYRAANRAITQSVIDALDPIGAEAVFVASSGAATKAEDTEATPAMRLYGAMKLNDEAAVANWAADRKVIAVICRIYNLTGPYINKLQAYAIASFICDALDGRSVKVQASRRVFRGYAAIHNLISLIFAIIVERRAGVIRFDSGGEMLELGEVAEQVVRTLGGKVERAEIVDSTVDCYVGDGVMYSRLLDQYGILCQSFEDQIRDTADFIQLSRSRSH